METVQQNGRFTLLVSTSIKAQRRTLMKLTAGVVESLKLDPES